MPVPDFQTLMLPLLIQYSDGNEHSLHEVLEKLQNYYSLSDQDVSEMLPSGKQTLFYNRVGWARTYLSKSGLLEMTKRSYYRITPRGRSILHTNPTRIDMKFLEQFPEYVEFREREGSKRTVTGGGYGNTNPPLEINKTPEEILEDAYEEIRENLAQEVLTLVKQNTPAFFERLVVELLVKMGYGGSRSDAARAVGQTGDEGIDGIIDEDRLGLENIYVQAKRWEAVVSRPEIQKFVGALMGKRARKGIFITTSHFSSEAISYVNNIDTKVVLIDGKRLAEFMIDYNVGVSEYTVYQLKRIDTDYFLNG